MHLNLPPSSLQQVLELSVLNASLELVWHVGDVPDGESHDQAGEKELLAVEKPTTDQTDFQGTEDEFPPKLLTLASALTLALALAFAFALALALTLTWRFTWQQQTSRGWAR